MTELRRFKSRLSKLGEILDSNRRRSGSKSGVITSPATTNQLEFQDACIRDHLGYPMPQALRALLEVTNGVGTQASVLYGTDEPPTKKGRGWDRRGVIDATLSRRDIFRDRDWLVIGENEFELFVMSPRGAEFAVYPFIGALKSKASLDDLLCEAIDIMIRSNPPQVV